MATVSNKVVVTDTPTLLLDADPKRIFARIQPMAVGLFVGPSDVAVSTGTFIDTNLVLRSPESEAALYGIKSTGTVDVGVLEINKTGGI